VWFGNGFILGGLGMKPGRDWAVCQLQLGFLKTNSDREGGKKHVCEHIKRRGKSKSDDEIKKLNAFQ